MSGFVITDAQLLDPVTGERRDGVSVRVEGERIVEVAEDGAVLAATADVAVIGAGGRTLMPGLIDAHVHAALTTLDLPALARRPATRVGIEAKTVLERMLRRGFTTVRDAGGLDSGIQEALRAGLVSGPRVSVQGACFPRWAATATSHRRAATRTSAPARSAARASRMWPTAPTPSGGRRARSSREVLTRSR